MVDLAIPRKSRSNGKVARRVAYATSELGQNRLYLMNRMIFNNNNDRMY
jgi:hypothetical protein